MHSDVERILYSEKDIENLVNSLAKAIEKDYNNKDFTALVLLKGSFVFASDLVRKINLDFPVEFMSVSSYGSGTVSNGKPKITSGNSVAIEGKNILIIEDIVDSGNTLKFIVDRFKEMNAQSVKICTLFDKPERREADIKPDYFGTVIPDEFIVGYGLDFDQKYRNLPYVGILKPEVYSDL